PLELRLLPALLFLAAPPLLFLTALLCEPRFLLLPPALGFLALAALLRLALRLQLAEPLRLGTRSLLTLARDAFGFLALPRELLQALLLARGLLFAGDTFLLSRHAL